MRSGKTSPHTHAMVGQRWPLDLSRAYELRDAHVVRDVNRPLRVPPRMMHGSQGDESTQVGVAGVGLLCSARARKQRGRAPSEPHVSLHSHSPNPPWSSARVLRPPCKPHPSRAEPRQSARALRDAHLPTRTVCHGSVAAEVRGVVVGVSWKCRLFGATPAVSQPGRAVRRIASA